MSLRGRFRFSLIVALAVALLSAVPSAARAEEKPLRPWRGGIQLFLETSMAKLWQGAFGWIAAGGGDTLTKAGVEIDPNGLPSQASPTPASGGSDTASRRGGLAGSSSSHE